jgi:tRNA(Ile)-lysidine synthase
VRWSGAEIRRYHDLLYAMAPLPPVDLALEFRWNMKHPLTVPGVGALRAASREGMGVRAGAIANAVTVRLRRGGERIRPLGRSETHTLKHLLQEAGVPPWRRDRLPLIWIDEHLVAVAGYWLAADYAATANETGVVFEFTPDARSGNF